MVMARMLVGPDGLIRRVIVRADRMRTSLFTPARRVPAAAEHCVRQQHGARQQGCAGLVHDQSQVTRDYPSAGSLSQVESPLAANLRSISAAARDGAHGLDDSPGLPLLSEPGG